MTVVENVTVETKYDCQCSSCRTRNIRLLGQCCRENKLVIQKYMCQPSATSRKCEFYMLFVYRQYKCYMLVVVRKWLLLVICRGKLCLLHVRSKVVLCISVSVMVYVILLVVMGLLLVLMVVLVVMVMVVLMVLFMKCGCNLVVVCKNERTLISCSLIMCVCDLSWFQKNSLVR